MSKRWGFRLVLAFLVFAMLEAIAWVGVRVMARSGLERDVSRFAGAAEVERRANPDHAPMEGMGPAYHEVLHPYVGYVMTASDPKKQDLGDLGWIQPQTLFKRSPERLIVGLMGGSVAHQIYELAGATLREGLAQSERFRGREVVLLRLCLGGYKQPQQLMILNYLLAQGAEFDVLINLDGFNEVALHQPENGAHGVAPIFPRWWHERVNDIADPEAQALAGELAYLQRKLRRLKPPDGPGLAGWFQMGRLVRAYRIKRMHREIAKVVARISKPGAGAARRYVATGPRENLKGDALYERLTDIWSRSSLQMHHTSRANGIAYYHFLQPNQYVEGSKPMGSDEKKRAFDAKMRYRAGVVKGYPGLIAKGQKLREQGVAYTDLTPLFASVEAPMYGDTCCHFLPEGAVAVGREMVRVISTAGSNRASGAPPAP